MIELLQEAFLACIIFYCVVIFLIWLFISSAVKHGTKKAILEAMEEYKRPHKTPQEDFEEEMKGWE